MSLEKFKEAFKEFLALTKSEGYGLPTRAESALFGYKLGLERAREIANDILEVKTTARGLIDQTSLNEILDAEIEECEKP